MAADPFWKTKRLAEMSREEWESLCDGCGQCCLVKLEDEDTGEIHLTSVACRLLDGATCRCTDYPNRLSKVDDCLLLTPDTIGDIAWLPETCAYVIVDRGGDLPWWHPLVSGRRRTVHEAGVSVSGRTVSEAHVAEEDLVNFLTDRPDSSRPATGGEPGAKSKATGRT